MLTLILAFFRQTIFNRFSTKSSAEHTIPMF